MDFQVYNDATLLTKLGFVLKKWYFLFKMFPCLFLTEYINICKNFCFISQYSKYNIYIQACSILLYSFYCLRDTDFKKKKTNWNIKPESSKSIRAIFPNSICSLHISVSHFGNSCNISMFFIIVILAIVIFDVTTAKKITTHKWLAFFNNKKFF